jgi:hypothetical protein
MKEAKFVCKKCGHRFTAVIYEEGEPEHKRVQGSPVQCPRCKSTSVERC